MTRLDFSISHVPGTQLHTADALSRAPKAQVEEMTELEEEVEAFIDGVLATLPATRVQKAEVEEMTELEEEVEAFIDGVVAALPATRVQRHTGKRSDMCEGARDL